MGRFLAIVIALVAIALAINYWQKEKPVDGEPKLVEPAKVDAPVEEKAAGVETDLGRVAVRLGFVVFDFGFNDPGFDHG